jgi:ELWxxDGT repeat protein
MSHRVGLCAALFVHVVGLACAQSAYRINIGPLQSHAPAIEWMTDVNGTLFFSADDGMHGKELWKSQGTTDTTAMVRDLFPGSTPGYPMELVNFHGLLLFNSRCELWRSDGTLQGTFRLKDFNYVSPTTPIYLTKSGDRAFMVANDGAGMALWKSDGTSQGTVLVRRFAAGSGAMPALHPTDVGGTLFFFGNDPQHGREIWTSDGTASGTKMVKDVFPGGPSGCSAAPDIVRPLCGLNGAALFQAVESISRNEQIWRSDGMEAGTFLLRDFSQDSIGAPGPHELTVVNGTPFFVVNATQLWKTNGTVAGTMLVKDGFSLDPLYLTPFGNRLFFAGATIANGREPWSSDGTPAGTALLRDITTGHSISNYNGEFCAAPKYRTLFFTVDSFNSPASLWRTDGTASGTLPVFDATRPGSLTPSGRFLYFVANYQYQAASDSLWVLPLEPARAARWDEYW